MLLDTSLYKVYRESGRFTNNRTQMQTEAENGSKPKIPKIYLNKNKRTGMARHGTKGVTSYIIQYIYIEELIRE